MKTKRVLGRTVCLWRSRKKRGLAASRRAACSARRSLVDCKTATSLEGCTGLRKPVDASFTGGVRIWIQRSHGWFLHRSVGAPATCCSNPQAHEGVSQDDVTGVLPPDWGSLHGTPLVADDEPISFDGSFPDFTGAVMDCEGTTLPLPACGKPATINEEPAGGDSATAELPLPGVENLGKQPVILKELGRGSFGRVFSCRWQGKTLAVKCKKTTGGVDTEVEILKILAQESKHCGILRLLGWGTQPRSKCTWLFFPLAACGDLRSLLHRMSERNELFRTEHIHYFTGALCSAVGHIHRHDVLHRDLKPGNILVHPITQPAASHRRGEACSWAWWRPTIADFGNSLYLGAGERQLPTRRFCTRQYTAPEVLLRGMEYSFPSDIWSLGVTIAEMEHCVHVMPSADCDLSQLCEAWKWCAAVGVTQLCDPLDEAIRRELANRMALAFLQRRFYDGSARLGAAVGSKFASIVRRCVQLEPTKRADALTLVALFTNDQPSPVVV